jgi:pimeloyl-ACP methyl ester carboxylesterase
MAALATRRHGTGPPVALIHGGLEDGAQTWPEQMVLAESWTLHVPDRVGYGASAGLSTGEDFDLDAELLAPHCPRARISSVTRPARWPLCSPPHAARKPWPRSLSSSHPPST